MGLNTPMRKLVDNDALQNLRDGVEKPILPVLPLTRSGDVAETGTLRVFATTDNHPKRHHGAVESPAISDNSGRPIVDADLRISTLLKRIMTEVAADEHQEDGTEMTNLEVLVRKLVSRALGENQFAMETVLDRIEGKPVRANQVHVADTALEEQIDKASVAALNNLLEPAK